jgi:hypothetical protein
MNKDKETNEDLVSVLRLLRAALVGARAECSAGVCDLLAGASALLERALQGEAESPIEETASTLVS